MERKRRERKKKSVFMKYFAIFFFVRRVHTDGA